VVRPGARLLGEELAFKLLGELVQLVEDGVALVLGYHLQLSSWRPCSNDIDLEDDLGNCKDQRTQRLLSKYLSAVSCRLDILRRYHLHALIVNVFNSGIESIVNSIEFAKAAADFLLGWFAKLWQRLVFAVVFFFFVFHFDVFRCWHLFFDLSCWRRLLLDFNCWCIFFDDLVSKLFKSHLDVLYGLDFLGEVLIIIDY